MADDDRVDENSSVGDIIARLTEDSKVYAKAVVAYVRELTGSKIRIVRAAAVLGAIALMFGMAALVAISVGAIMVLTRFVGPLGATLIVAFVTLLLMALFGWFSWKRMSELLRSDP